MAESKKQMKNQYRLTEEEISNPNLVIEDLYSFIHHDEAKVLLWKWLKATVCGNFSTDLEPNEKASIMTLYEKIEKLLDAADIINERTKNK